MQTKTCTQCRGVKPVDQFFRTGFHPSGKEKRRGNCRECAMKDTVKWRDKNRSHYNNYVAMWRAKNPDRQHATEIKRNYGITIDVYLEMLKKQNNRCQICEKLHDTTKKRGRLFVDHCHATGKVRGLLCVNCNTMIGHADDNVKTLQKAIAYLSQ